MRCFFAALAVLLPVVAYAQSVPFDGTKSQIPNQTAVSTIIWNPSQWRQAWASKADVNNPIFTGTVNAPAVSVTGLATLTGGQNFGGTAQGTLAGGGASINFGTGAASFGGETDIGTGSQSYFQIVGGTTAGGPVIQLGGAVNSSTPMTITAGGGGPLRLTGGARIVQSWSSQLQLSPPNTVWSGTNSYSNTALFMSPTYTGTFAGTGQIFGAYLGAAWNASVGSGAGNGGLTLGVHADVGGSSMLGNAGAFGATLDITATTLNTTAAGGSYVSAYSQAYANVNDNGTSGATKGLLYAFNTVAQLGPAATNWNSLISYEADVSTAVGSSMAIRLGIQIVDVLGGAAGSTDDQALSLNNSYRQGTGSVGWNIGIGFGRKGGYFPMSATGTMIAAVANVGGDMLNAAYGIDFSAVTFASGFLKSTGFLVDGSGNITAPSIGNGASAFKLAGSGSWTANGSTAVSLTSIAPSGAHATVQEWLTITDSAGNIRYIPAF